MISCFCLFQTRGAIYIEAKVVKRLIEFPKELKMVLAVPGAEVEFGFHDDSKDMNVTVIIVHSAFYMYHFAFGMYHVTLELPTNGT